MKLKGREVRLEVSALWRATATVAPYFFANQATEGALHKEGTTTRSLLP
jgi:hypothetical protein